MLLGDVPSLLGGLLLMTVGAHADCATGKYASVVSELCTNEAASASLLSFCSSKYPVSLTTTTVTGKDG